MGKMTVTYMNKKSGHGDMGDKYTFIRCHKCDGKYVEETTKSCPHCGGKGLSKDSSGKDTFDAAVQKEVDKRMALEAASKKNDQNPAEVAAEKEARIAAEVAAENAADEKAATKSKK